MSIKIKHWSDKSTMQTVYEFKIPVIQTMVTDEQLYFHPAPKELVKHQVLKYIASMIDEAFDKAEEEEIEKLKWTAAEATTVNIDNQTVHLLPGDSVEVSFDPKYLWNDKDMGDVYLKYKAHYLKDMKLGEAYISPDNMKYLLGIGEDYTKFSLDPAQATTGHQVNEILSVFPGLKEKAACPHSPCAAFNKWPVRDVIIHLNDHHKWSREAIADWLETLDININMEEEDANNSNPGAFDAGQSPSA